MHDVHRFASSASRLCEEKAVMQLYDCHLNAWHHKSRNQLHARHWTGSDNSSRSVGVKTKSDTRRNIKSRELGIGYKNEVNIKYRLSSNLRKLAKQLHTAIISSIDKLGESFKTLTRMSLENSPRILNLIGVILLPIRKRWHKEGKPSYSRPREAWCRCPVR